MVTERTKMLKDQGKSGKKSIVLIKLQDRNVDTFNLQENIDQENAQNVDESLFSSARDCCCNGDALSGGKTSMLLLGLRFSASKRGKHRNLQSGSR